MGSGVVLCVLIPRMCINTIWLSSGLASDRGGGGGGESPRRRGLARYTTGRFAQTARHIFSRQAVLRGIRALRNRSSRRLNKKEEEEKNEEAREGMKEEEASSAV